MQYNLEVGCEDILGRVIDHQPSFDNTSVHNVEPYGLRQSFL